MKQFPPIDDQLLEYKFPAVIEDKLENGLTVLTVEDHRLPKIYFRMGVCFGEKNDPAASEGAAQLISQLIRKGTRSRSYRQIVEEIESAGGSLHAAVSSDFFYIYGDFLDEHFGTGLELLDEIVQHPTLPPDEFQKEQHKLIANLENQKSSPDFLAHRRMNAALFQPHPYARTYSQKSIERISRELLMELHRRYFTPGNAYLVLAGDVSRDAGLKLAQKFLSGWDGEGPAGTDFPVPAKPGRRAVHLVNRPGSAQSNIQLGNLLFPRNHPDYIPVTVMNKILGGGASGRLFLNLREEKGYTYGAYSNPSAYLEAGGWTAGAEVRTEVTGKALEAFFEEFEKIRSEKVTEEELRNARRYLIGVFPLQNETPAAVAGQILTRKLYRLPEDYWNRYPHEVQKVSAEMVQEMARRYILPDKMRVVVVGDAEKIQPELEQFGPVKIFDLDDNPVA